jgi:hypothetical protein
MNKFFYFILISNFLFAHIAMAKTLELKKDSKSIFIEEKPKWKLGKDLFGMPFIYFSPKTNGQRSNISFTDTGASLELDMKSLSDGQGTFKTNKEKWAKTVGATPLEFTPYTMKVSKLGHRIHQIGFSYKHEDKEYVERSNYIECRGKIIFSKSLRLKVNEPHAKEFDDLLNGIDCGGI